MQARIWITSVLAVVAVGCSSVTARAGLPPFPCGPTMARTLALTRLARAYTLRDEVYGCARGGRSYKLGSSRLCTSSERIGPVALSGTVAAYGARRCGVDTGTARVVVRRLTGGAVLHTAAATSRVPGAESYESVGSLVVRADGAVAWIGTAHSIVGRGRLVEVHRFDRRGPTQLDQGAGIAPGSLRLRGSQITWLHSGSSRSADLS